MNDVRYLKKILVFTALSVCLTGCNNSLDETTAEAEAKGVTVEYVEKEEITEQPIADKSELYEDIDDTSVIKMYLTVSSGNEADGTNHTWKEINTYSAYDYEDMGVDRYKVDGVLQIDEGDGIGADSFGYGVDIPNVSVQVRGQSSSKALYKNYKVRIKEGKGSFRDQRTLNLNKHPEDPYRFINKLSYTLMKDIPHLVGGRTQFVNLYVCDTTAGGSGVYEDYGLYTMVEQTNKKYLKSRGFDDNGL